MQTITIPTDSALAGQRYAVSGRRVALLRVDAPIEVQLSPGGPLLPFDRPGRIANCGGNQITDLFVTINSGDTVAGGSVIVASDNDVEFDFPGGGYLQPAEWTERASADNATATATRAAVTSRRHILLYVEASFSDATVSKLLTVKRGATTIIEQYIHGSGTLPLEFRGNVSEAVSAELAASGVGGTLGKVNIVGYTV